VENRDPLLDKISPRPESVALHGLHALVHTKPPWLSTRSVENKKGAPALAAGYPWRMALLFQLVAWLGGQQSWTIPTAPTAAMDSCVGNPYYPEHP